MKYKLEKCTRIVNDLIMYCSSLGATGYHVDYKTEEDKCSFKLCADVTGVEPELIEELAADLGQHRMKEVEELYWSISYDSDSPGENTTLGMMLDEAKVSYDGYVLVIEGIRRD